jgi:hypothetical protein
MKMKWSTQGSGGSSSSRRKTHKEKTAGRPENEVEDSYYSNTNNFRAALTGDH